MTSSITIWAQGLPGSQGSKRPVGQAKEGRTIMIESDKKVKPWRTDVKDAAENARREAGWLNPRRDPIVLVVVFYALRPRNHYRTGKRAGELKDWAPEHPSVKPDLDKLIRAVGDALKAAGVYQDDSQVIRIVADKVYARDDFDSPKPGAIITVIPVGGDE